MANPDEISGAGLSFDDDGNPTVVGLQTTSTGDLSDGTGAFEGISGEQQTDSELFLSGGDMDLGLAITSLQMQFATQAASSSGVMTASAP